MMKHTIQIILASLCVLVYAFVPYNTSAQVKVEPLNSGRVYGDFVVGPGKTEVTVEPGTSKTVNITVSNRMGTERVFTIDVEDFTGSDDLSQPVVLLGNERGPYSLKDYIHVRNQTFTLKHDERATIPVTISVPFDAEPGGRYGSVLVSTASLPNENESGGSAAVISRVGSLFFLTVPGDIKKEGALAEFDTKESKSFYLSGPIEHSILYENKGNMYLNPYGYISITNMFGEEVGRVEVKPWFAMPNSLRLREVAWDKPFLFGKYTATLSLNRGYDNIVDTSSVTFFVLPLKHILLSLLVVFIVVFLGYVILSKFEIKRK